MTALTKEAFLKSQDRKKVWVPLPEELYGADSGFYVRVLSGKERSEIERMFVNDDPKNNPGKFRGTVIAMTVVGEQDTPIFRMDDIPALLEKNAGTLETLFEKSCEINGFTKNDVERIEKN